MVSGKVDSNLSLCMAPRPHCEAPCHTTRGLDGERVGLERWVSHSSIIIGRDIGAEKAENREIC